VRQAVGEARQGQTPSLELTRGHRSARSLYEPPSEVAMQNNMNGVMGGNGLWTVIGVLLVIFLIVAIVKMVQKK
jgi:hypothetical protein